MLLTYIPVLLLALFAAQLVYEVGHVPIFGCEQQLYARNPGKGTRPSGPFAPSSSPSASPYSSRESAPTLSVIVNRQTKRRAGGARTLLIEAEQLRIVCHLALFCQ